MVTHLYCGPLTAVEWRSLLSYIEDLPDDPELAFAELVGRYSDTLSEAVGRSNYSDHYTECMEYLVRVTSAVASVNVV